jgi:hypothetical protein
MKKIILMMFMLLAAVYWTQAQSSFVGTATNPTRAILNSAADTALYSTTASYSVITIQTKVTKSSGTMAGKVYIWSSPDGASYILRDSASLGNSTNQYSPFDYTGQIRHYWMVIMNGATTTAGTLNAKIWGAGR